MSKRLASALLLTLTVALSGCRERPQNAHSVDSPVTTSTLPKDTLPKDGATSERLPVPPQDSPPGARSDDPAEAAVPTAPLAAPSSKDTLAPKDKPAPKSTSAAQQPSPAVSPSTPAVKPEPSVVQQAPAVGRAARPQAATPATVSPSVAGPVSRVTKEPAPTTPQTPPAVVTPRPEVSAAAPSSSSRPSPAVPTPSVPAPGEAFKPARPVASLQAEAHAKPVSPPVAGIAPTPVAPAPGVKPPERRGGELRGLWVDAFGPGFKTPQEVDQLISDARRMNVNVLFVQVGKRGDCYCNSASMPRTDDPEVPAGFDPLQDVLTKAHAAGLQVHAWIITTAVVNVADHPNPTQADHVFNTNGLTASGEANWLMLRQDGEARAGNDYFLDPGHPEASAYIAEMYLSIVRNYDVDGVQLDRVRYPDAGGMPAWGYNPVALERFRQERGVSGTPAPTDPVWMAWRREQVTNLVRHIYLGVKTIKPEVWVGVATITYGPGPRSVQAFEASRTYNEVLQDWAQWARLGYFDLNVLMNYKRDDVPDQARWYAEWNDFAARHRGTRLVAAGSAMYLNKLSGTLQQVNGALAAGLDGWVGYSYRTSDTSVNSGTRTTAQALPELTARFVSAGGPFGQAQSWKRPDTRALRAVEGRLAWNDQAASGQSLGGRTVELYVNGRVFARTQTDGHGRYGFVFAPPGPFEVRTEGAPSLKGQAENGRVVELPALLLP